MSRRYFSETPIAGPDATLAGPEAHHLLHVLRAAPGMEVVLFDGGGGEFDARVARCGRSTVKLTVGPRRDVDRELPFEFTLGVPLPKGDRQRWIVEKATELGVTRLVPLVVERSPRGAAERGDKLVRYVVEASKQCGRNRLMEIAEPLAWDEWLALPGVGADAEGTTRRWVAHPVAPPLDASSALRATPTFAAVGPEGGLTDEEVAMAVGAGWKLAGLGPRVLRIETAAVALAALIGCLER